MSTPTIKVFLQYFLVLSLLGLSGVEGTCVNVNPTDVVFVVDSSGSICDTDPGYVYLRDKTCNNWVSILNFMAGLVNQLNIDPSAVMVGLVIFQNNAKVAWTLDKYPTKAGLLHAINNLAYIGGDTATTLGLRAMRTQVFGQVGDRQNAANVAIVITDGNPTILVSDLPYEVQLVQSQGITMVAVGITNAINENVLRSLSSSPQQLNINYFMSPDFQSINSISQRLEVYTFCPSEAPVLDQTTTTTGNPCTSTTFYSDIVFVVDGSGSICDTDPYFVYGRDSTCGNWLTVINFMKTLVSDLTIGPSANRVAVVVFYTYAYVAWNLDRYNDKSSLLNAFDQLRYDPGGDTATTDGLVKMRTEVFGQPGDRPTFTNMAIIITDGRPTIRVAELQSEIDRNQNAGVAMYAIGVTNSIDEATLKKLSSRPQLINQNYFMSPDFNSIITIKSSFQTKVICPETPPPGPIITDDPCRTTSTVADITFVVDTSGSICDTDPNYIFGRDMNCNNFELLKTFLKNLVSSLNIGPNANRVALVIFRSSAYVAWPLDRYFDSNSLVNAIDQLRYDPGGDTATTDGLLKMRTEVFGQPGDRSGISNVAITITDGRPTIRVADLQDEITKVQAAGINMVAIGVTNSIDELTLKKLSSPPQQRDVNYFMTADYNTIDTVKRGLQVQVLCPTSSPPRPVLDTTTTRKVCQTVNRMDIVFVIDNSGSICDTDPLYVYPRDRTCNNWRLVLNFMKDLVTALPISAVDVRVGLVTFHSYAVVHWTLDKYLDKYSLLNAIDQVKYVGGDTATADGLNKMRTQVFSQVGDRSGVNNIAIVITDGRPTVGVNNLSNEEYLNQVANINVVAIGVTNSIDEYTLSMISSPPYQRNTNYFMSPDFMSINLIKEKLEKATFCPDH